MKEIPLFGVVNLPEMERAAIEVLRSGQIANGEYVAQFEAGLGQIVGSSHVVSTIDMTTAIFLALHLAGVRPGDEVLTAAYSCMSTNSAIAQIGAKPVWVDVDANGVEMSVSDLRSKLTRNVKAILLYHVAGYPGPAEEIAAICRSRGISLIEDCNNALFATKNDLHVGAHGDFAVYSFYPNRQINATEGGALVCKDARIAARARRLRRFGIDGPAFRTPLGEVNPNADIPEVGWSMTLNNFCSALGCMQLQSAEMRVEQSRRNAERLTESVRGLPGMRLVTIPTNSRPAYWVLLLLVDNNDAVLQKMRSHGVRASYVHYRNDAYSGFGALAATHLPNTTYLQRHILAIPCGWWLSDADLCVIETALEASSRTGGNV